MVVRPTICAQSVDIRTTLSWLHIEPCNAACGDGAYVRLRWSRGPTQNRIVEGERRRRCRRGLRTSCTIGQGPGCDDERWQCCTIEVVIQAVEQSRSHNMHVTAAVDLGYQQGISSHSQPDTPRRKLLFVPGDSASKLFSLSCLLSPAFSSVRFHITCSRMRRLARKAASSKSESKPQTKTNTNDRKNGIYTASKQ